MDDLTQVSNSVKALVPYPVSFTNVTRTEVTFTFPWNQNGIRIFVEGKSYSITVPTTEYTVTGLRPGQICTFSIEEPYFPPDLYLPNTVSIATLRNKPTKPTYLGSLEHNIDSVLLYWVPGTVDGGEAFYDVERDERAIKEKTKETGYRDLTPEQGRTYIYSVCTVDDQGNKSDRTTLTLSFDDITPPTEISNLRTTALSLQALWEPASDSSKKLKYDVYLNGELKGTTEETAFSFTELESGERYQICVEAEDASGNKSKRVCASYPLVGIPFKHKQ